MIWLKRNQVGHFRMSLISYPTLSAEIRWIKPNALDHEKLRLWDAPKPSNISENNSTTCQLRVFFTYTLSLPYVSRQARTLGGNSGTMATKYFCASPNFVVTRKISFKHIIKTKIFPPETDFASKTLKPNFGPGFRTTWNSCVHTRRQLKTQSFSWRSRNPTWVMKNISFDASQFVHNCSDQLDQWFQFCEMERKCYMV